MGSYEFYFYLLKPVVPPLEGITMADYLESLSDEQKQIVFQHFDYMDKLKSENKILVGGPLLNAQGLVVIFQVESEAEVKELISKEPTLVNKFFRIAESHPMRIAVSSSKIANEN